MKAKTYLIKWPNGTISILTARNNSELADKMDVEGDPTDPETKIFSLPQDFHLEANVVKQGEEIFIACDQLFEHNMEKMKRHKFPKNMGAKHIANMAGVPVSKIDGTELGNHMKQAMGIS